MAIDKPAHATSNPPETVCMPVPFHIATSTT
jgi:hypothetical protein